MSGSPVRELPLQLLDVRHPVGQRWAEVLTASPEADAELSALVELLFELPSNGKASPDWKAAAREHAADLTDAGSLVADLIEVLLTTGTVTPDGYQYYLPSADAEFALGVLRLAGVLDEPALVPQLSRLARYMIQFVGGQYGSARSVKLANAAVIAIGDITAPTALAELLTLERTLRHGTLLKQIAQAIGEQAAARGMTRDELLEQAVERHGLDASGCREFALGVRGSARIEVTGRAASLLFVDEHGVVKRSFPADVKEGDADQLDELKSELKEVRKTLAGERHRLDRLLTSGRCWEVADWRRYYVDHPLTGRLTRGLIWNVSSPTGTVTPGLPVDGQTLRLADGATASIPEDATLTLWHPVLATADEVSAWRSRCIADELVQPIKQAFRETYVVTPAELETRTYSNRFAGHVFRQVQARGLMKTRGWSAPPLAWWDDGRDHGLAKRPVPNSELEVVFAYDPITEYEPDGGELIPLCSSDQVRFLDEAGEAVPLADVPLVALSEALRDVDLFIGVTSIGADPEWEDRGDGPLAARLQEYWHDYSFGELGASAAIRREVIAGLLPALAISERLGLDERFLTVRGELRSYRIHLGSGNIQMEPNSEYLCIVSARKAAASKLFLPMDDDPVLTLILSKAFLLAADDRITDPTIVAQIQRQ